LDGILANPSESLTLRRAAAFALSTVNSDDGRSLLVARLATAHYRLATDIAAALSRTRQGTEMLLDTITEGKASPQLLREPAVQRGMEAVAVAGLAKRVAELTKNLSPQSELTAQLIADRRAAFRAAQPNAERGQEVFTKHCAVCHQMADEGKKFGPDLDGIGVRGLDRLLEDLLDPSRNVDPAFRTTIVITDRGLTRTGLAVRDDGQVLLLVDAEGKEHRISHNEIDERAVSPLSPMPNAVEKALDADDFNHLLRFLLDASAASE
jgi:putative heme-binding domain-containing protein